ncbi:hypothetical protein NRS6141_00760 [Bacillus subtilis]|nr:hypothetical protein NRS6141_00760 [Bacillus subtilis]CAF1877294.1 hypothetical protein NRS6204_00352 [Bacillus subtilis]CAF1879297.1 hypothetical protein NRS6205_00352 [Bacillus subtilis]
MYIQTREMPEDQKDFLRNKFDELLERNSSLCITCNKDEYNEVVMQIEFRYFQPNGVRVYDSINLNASIR